MSRPLVATGTEAAAGTPGAAGLEAAGGAGRGNGAGVAPVDAHPASAAETAARPARSASGGRDGPGMSP